MSIREVLWIAVALVSCQFAIGIFDEWRVPLQWLSRLLFVAIIAFFSGRALWRWWRGLSEAAAGRGVWVAMAFASVGWIDLALARGVAGMSEGNYALIVIAPLMMMLGTLVSLGGIVAAGVATAAIVRAVWTVPILRTSDHDRLAVVMG